MKEEHFDTEDNFNDSLLKNSRNNFIQKVYSIVTVQLIATGILTAIAVYNPSFRDFQT